MEVSLNSQILAFRKLGCCHPVNLYTKYSILMFCMEDPSPITRLSESEQTEKIREGDFEEMIEEASRGKVVTGDLNLGLSFVRSIVQFSL